MTPVDRPVSAQTFGNSRTHLIAPTPQRSPSARRVRTPEPEARPTLMRSQTPGAPETQPDIARMFSENMFADPAPQKAWRFGPKLYTDGHQRLIYILREECGRLYSFTNSLKNKIATLERQAKANAEAMAEMRHTLHARNDRLAQVTADLREQHDIVREMDADLERTRNKRLSRVPVPSLDADNVTLGDYAR